MNVLAADYPLLEVFWTMVWFFLWVIWIWLLIVIFGDIFRSDDLSGWGKAGWSILLIVLPLIGALVYLIARGGTMHERAADEARRRDEMIRSYALQTTQSTSPAEELTKLSELRATGVITEEEFQQLKAAALG